MKLADIGTQILRREINVSHRYESFSFIIKIFHESL